MRSQSVMGEASIPQKLPEILGRPSLRRLTSAYQRSMSSLKWQERMKTILHQFSKKLARKIHTGTTQKWPKQARELSKSATTMGRVDA
jgi:hypothetical protein